MNKIILAALTLVIMTGCVHTDRPSAVVACFAQDDHFYYQGKDGWTFMRDDGGKHDWQSTQDCIQAWDTAHRR